MPNNIGDGRNPLGHVPPTGQEWDTSETDTPAATPQEGARRPVLAKLRGLLPRTRTESGDEEGQSITRRRFSGLGVHVMVTRSDAGDVVCPPPNWKQQHERHATTAWLTIGDPFRRAPFASIEASRTTKITFADVNCRRVPENDLLCVHDSRVSRKTRFGIGIGGKEANFEIPSRAKRMDVRYFHPTFGLAAAAAEEALRQADPPEGTIEGDDDQTPSIE